MTSNSAPLGSRVTSFFRSINDGLVKFNDSVTLARDLQLATSQLKSNLHVERLIINTALKMAKSAISLEIKMKEPMFREAYEELSGIFKDVPSETEPISISPIPTFERIAQHTDPETEGAIQRKFEELKADREVFLTSVHVQMVSNPALYGHFLKNLQELNGHQYLKALDPKYLLNHV